MRDIIQNFLCLLCILIQFNRYSVKAAISSVLLLASISAIDAFPLAKRAAPQSPSFASLPKPILAPYYLYFGNMQVTLSDAFDSLGMNAATVGFLSAPEGNVSILAPLIHSYHFINARSVNLVQSDDGLGCN